MVTTAERVQGVQDITYKYKVIDSDTHFNEWPEMWTERVPAKYKERVPHLRKGKDADVWVIEGDQELGYFGGGQIKPDGTKSHAFGEHKRVDQVTSAAYDVKARLALMDMQGITAQITYPQLAGFSAVKLMKAVRDPELRTIITTTFNDGMAEVQRQSGNRIFPQALLPAWEDQAAMMKEARRAIEDLHMTGFVMGDRPELIGLPGYGTDYWQPLFEYCNDKRIPLNFHLAGSSAVDAAAVPWDTFGPQRKVAVLSVMFFLANAGFVSNFIYSGLLDRYRNLKLVSVESGIGWIPFVLEALEYQYDETIPDEVKLSRRPTELFRDHILTTFWFEKAAFDYKLIDLIGVENVMFETDFPHSTCLYPDNRQHASKALAGMSEYARRRILQDNAIELYHLPIAVGA